MNQTRGVSLKELRHVLKAKRNPQGHSCKTPNYTQRHSEDDPEGLAESVSSADRGMLCGHWD